MNDNGVRDFPAVFVEVAANPRIGKMARTFEARDGMTLRDYFAAHIFPAMLSDGPTVKLGLDSMASAAYAMADALLKAREA